MSGWAPGPTEQPIPPPNGQVISPFFQGVLDIRWDNPAILARNAAFVVIGVNVYRSDVSERGPYFRLNEFPVGGTFFRDRTENVQVVKELVDWNKAWVTKGDAPNSRRWTFRTTQPIVKRIAQAPYQTPTMANSPKDVTLYFNGVETPVHEVFGPSGEVTLINQNTFNLITEKWDGVAIPTADSTVEITYWANRNQVRSGLDARLYYRLSTVVQDATTPSGYRETALDYCPPLTLSAVETMDYIWREAVRRNSWILQQGGERVKAFIRKQSGVICTCGKDDRTAEFDKQPSNRCMTCLGTGFVGGYEGPYDIIIAPDDAERRISQVAQGRRKEHTYEVWTGPTPLLTQRDFICKQTNERYSVGPVRRPSNRGNLLQQHFNIGYLDEGDIRYQVPIDGVELMTWPQTRYPKPYFTPMPVDGALPDQPQYPTGPDAQIPMETNKPTVPAETQQRGRSPVWENQNEGILLLLAPLAGALINALSQGLC